MRVEVYWIADVNPGRLGIMPRPRGGDWLEDEIRSLKAMRVDAVASLLEREEIAELDIKEEADLCLAHGLAYLSFPIRDRSVPPSANEALNFARTLFDLIRAGRSVVIHCRQGVG
ncbi:MAG TPA: hypothetical protein VEV81_06165, partial [Pyrinomonadaceae bacterium]|nr:hypothetical protein [Pyrinomonadaceae bacterium]